MLIQFHGIVGLWKGFVLSHNELSPLLRYSFLSQFAQNFSLISIASLNVSFHWSVVPSAPASGPCAAWVRRLLVTCCQEAAGHVTWAVSVETGSPCLLCLLFLFTRLLIMINKKIYTVQWIVLPLPLFHYDKLSCEELKFPLEKWSLNGFRILGFPCKQICKIVSYAIWPISTMLFTEKLTSAE